MNLSYYSNCAIFTRFYQKENNRCIKNVVLLRKRLYLYYIQNTCSWKYVQNEDCWLLLSVYCETEPRYKVTVDTDLQNVRPFFCIHGTKQSISIITDSCSLCTPSSINKPHMSITVTKRRKKCCLYEFETEELSRSDSTKRPRHCDEESLVTLVRLLLVFPLWLDDDEDLHVHPLVPHLLYNPLQHISPSLAGGYKHKHGKHKLIARI